MKFLKVIQEKSSSLNELIIFETKTNHWINISLLYKHWALGYKFFIWMKKNYLIETAKGIEHKNKEILKENRTFATHGQAYLINNV